MITELGEPDEIKINPRYPKNLPMKLWKFPRVYVYFLKHKKQVLQIKHRREASKGIKINLNIEYILETLGAKEYDD